MENVRCELQNVLTDFESELIYRVETWLAAHGVPVGYSALAALLMMLPTVLRATADAIRRMR